MKFIMCLIVLTGCAETYGVSSHGIANDCEVDATGDLNALIASTPDGTAESPTVIEFDPNDCYRVDGTLLIANRTGLRFEGNGATFRRVDTAEPHGAEWWIKFSSYISFHDMTVEGVNTAPFRSTGAHTPFEFDHLFACWACADTTIEGVTGRYSWGDFVDIQQAYIWPNYYAPSNVTVRDSTFTNSGRHGVAITAGSGHRVERNQFNDVAWSMVDLEPEITTLPISDVSIVGNRLGRVYHSFIASAGGLPLISNIELRDNTMTEIPTTSPNYTVLARGSNWTVLRNYLTTRTLGLRALDTSNTVFDGNLLFGRNFNSKPFESTNSNNVTVKGNIYLTNQSPGTGFWTSYTSTNSTNVTLCGNRRETTPGTLTSDSPCP